ncbi:hypothetical protein CCHR01_14052 [Colletotrichum chrysophilum]|uniref:Uncharacterized protein n=1 Tax=Colletotrichum chrysophilum TaxID=1836956 RepID=A0AAD9A8Z9_9PEZI|nr:hypothetical protein CCHR01_14052 [Colletotrichum chrysophilum]
MDCQTPLPNSHQPLSLASGPAKRRCGKDRFPFIFALPAASSGEQAASALEANLTNLENRLDALLAAFESSEGGAEAPKDTNDTHNGNTPSGQKHNEGSGPDASGAAKKP